jgi:hypothetical protein
MSHDSFVKIPVTLLSFEDLQPGMAIIYQTERFNRDIILSVSREHADLQLVKMKSGVTINNRIFNIFPDNAEMKTYFLLAEIKCLNNNWWHL